MSVLRIQGLNASVAGKQILNGIDLEINSGQVHAVMGPNGSGKSTLAHVVMGRPGYTDVSGSVTIDGQELLGLSTAERARAGLFLAMQYPIEVPGVSLQEAMRHVKAINVNSGDKQDNEIDELLALEAKRVGLDPKILLRDLNVDLSGGERKRNETLQLAALNPRFAILDEIDSGLDIDALRAVARRVEAQTSESDLGVLAITHYSRLFAELKPDVVHVLAKGRIADTGGPELADELERSGYAGYVEVKKEPSTRIKFKMANRPG